MQAPEAIALPVDAHQLKETLMQAGEIALRHFQRDVDVRKKSDGTPVSEADLAVDAFLRRELQGGWPEYGWLSEESGRQVSRSSRKSPVWIVDPIDGTKSFLRGDDNWCISVALVLGGRPCLAAVWAPVRQEYYEARTGQQTRLNGKSIAASRHDTIEGSRISMYSKVLDPQRWSRPWPAFTRTETKSLVLRLCMVASGECDAAIAPGAKADWDLAAGDLIVHGAGGRVTDLAGKKLLYDIPGPPRQGVMASSGPLFDELFQQVRTFKG